MSDPNLFPTPYREAIRHSYYRDLTIWYEGYSQEMPHRVPDISTEGMFVHTQHSFPEGSVLKIRFILNRSRHEINARAEVRYCLPGVGIGVEFIDLPEEDKQAIAREIEA
jgi:hypothetical protein